MTFVDDFIGLLVKVTSRKGNNADMEALRSQFLRMMSAPESDVTPFAPAQAGTDVDKLDGQDGSYYQDATNLNAGTVHTDRYSAYADLSAEGKIGTGAAQVAAGDHTHGANTGGDIFWYIDGRMATGTGLASYVVPRAATLQVVYAQLGDKGSAGSTIIDVHKNGTTIFTTQANRPTIAYDDADGVVSATPDVTSVAAGDVLTLDIDQIGTAAGRLAVGIALNFSYSTPAEPRTAIFTIEDMLEVGTGKLRIYNKTGATKTIQEVLLSVSNAPTGAAIIVDVNKDGATIFTNQANRPQIAAGANTGTSTNIDVSAWESGKYLTVDLDQVGSTSPGYNLTVTVVYV